MKTLRPLIALFALVVAAASDPAPATAQESGDPIQGLVSELRSELDRAEKERLIDPWFLRDLRRLLDSYDWPWQNRILSDDFSGRGPGPDAPWQVTAGEFLIDWRYGLRSVIEAPVASCLTGTTNRAAYERPPTLELPYERPPMIVQPYERPPP